MFIGILILVTLIFLLTRKKKQKLPEGVFAVPKVKGSLPYFGHGLAFSKDIIKFVRENRQKYGPIYRVKIFNRDVVIISDHEMKHEFFKATEDEMSLYRVLSMLYFGDAFSDNPDSLDLIIGMVKQTVAVEFDKFVVKILDEAKSMIDRMKTKEGQINLADEMIKFVACTSARCFIGVALSDEIFNELMKFSKILNKIVVATYFLPKSLIRLVAEPILKRSRRKIINFLDPFIEEYRQDLSKNESMMFRKCVDWTSDNGEKLNNQQISEIVICLLYVSSENTALGLSATLTDLINYPEYYQKTAEISQEFLENEDIRGLVNNRFINACVMESARMNTHVFPLSRHPINKNATIKGSDGKTYFIGDATCVALCEPVMMLHEDSKNKESIKYYPERFLEEPKEKITPKNVMTWGAGVHVCPGKQFALYEIKVAVALITNNFDIDMINLGKLDYFSPSAFAERKSIVNLRIKQQVQNKTLIKKKVNGLILSTFKTEEGSGWLIQNMMSVEDQVNMYRYLVDLVPKEDFDKIKNAPKHMACSIAYDNLVYTGESNCESPVKFYDLAQEAWNLLMEHGEDFVDLSKNFNSMYAQLFHKEASMKSHKDEFVDWGVSISFGCAVQFNFGEHKILLNSGDIFVADFSKVEHAVESVLWDTVPGWYQDKFVETFGKARASIQIRDLHHLEKSDLPALTSEQFQEMLKARNVKS